MKNPTLFGCEILPVCPECGDPVKPAERQELKLVRDKDGVFVWTRECGVCLDKDKSRAKLSNTTGHIDPSKHGRFGEKA